MRRLVPVLAMVVASWAAAEAPTSVTAAQATQEAVVRKLESDDYNHVMRGHREKIARAQQELAALPQDGGDSEVARAAALVEEIDALMADAELDRQVCHRERPLGSNRMVKVCRTKRQMADQAEQVRNAGPMRSTSCGYTSCN